MVSLAGQVAVITGAGSGIGAEVAGQLSAEGVRLVLTGRTESKLQALQAELVSNGASTEDILVVTGSVADAGHAKAVVERALGAFGRLDVLVNNAGIAGKIALFQEISVDEVNETLDTNLKGAIFMMQEALRQAMVPRAISEGMDGRCNGTIINVNSIAGKSAFPFWSLYNASKFGLRAITEAVAAEQRENGIKVVGVHPGAVRTPIWDAIDMAEAPNLEGMLAPESVASAVLYILKQPETAFIPDITIEPLKPAL